MTQEKSLTPMMQQWDECKVRAKDALLLFRLGDFYEAFYEDAQVISKELHLTLTQRQNIPMCGVPFHTCDTYIDKLVAQGYKVAVAEQVEDPKNSKGLVKREVVRFISPATLVSSNLLQDKSNNYFVSIHQVGSSFGIAYIDLTTGEFKVIEVSEIEDLLNEITRIKPTELLLEKKFKEKHKNLLDDLSKSFTFSVNVQDSWFFDHQLCLQKLISHFNVSTLDGFGMKGMLSAINACGALIMYLQEELSFELSHIRTIQVETLSSYMSLDRTTSSHLEICESFHSHSNNSLLQHLDKTQTSMGGRLIKKWIQHPLLDLHTIYMRQGAIEQLMLNPFAADESLEQIKDLERLAMKVKNRYETPRDLYHLVSSLEKIQGLKKELSFAKSEYIEILIEKLHDFTPLCTKVLQAMDSNPPLRTSDGSIFVEGFNSELDEVRSISTNSKQWLADYQNTLRKESGIKTLKIGYTRVFGYYIDVSKGSSQKVPPYFQRRQTLVNSERYVTEDLKNYEIKIFSAEETMKALELKLYEKIREEVSEHFNQILESAYMLAQIDVLFSLAKVALEHEYTKPVVDNSDKLIIEKGRHPILEKVLGKNQFIPNDIAFSTDSQMFLITGPNMAGKSTYIRQVALLVILAQMGSFVPATKAHIGLVDKVFSRIGASDDLSRGQSTFMMEMCETAHILHNATSRSLVILDEIGRGTSTYDGISIAWAVCEYLLTTPNQKAKTLFATHYWELTELEKKFPLVTNLQVKVKEGEKGVMFLHKIEKGATDKSYGIHVAKLAGLPEKAIYRAEKMLQDLEKKHRSLPKEDRQMHFLHLEKEPSPLISQIQKIDTNQMTPIEALLKLQEIQKSLR